MWAPKHELSAAVVFDGRRASLQWAALFLPTALWNAGGQNSGSPWGLGLGLGSGQELHFSASLTSRVGLMTSQPGRSVSARDRGAQRGLQFSPRSRLALSELGSE